MLKNYNAQFLKTFASKIVIVLFCLLFQIFNSYSIVAQSELPYASEGLPGVISYNGTYQDFIIPDNPNIKIEFFIKGGNGGSARVHANDFLFRGDYTQEGGSGELFTFSISVGSEFPIGSTLRFIIGNHGVNGSEGANIGQGHSYGGGGGGTAILIKKPGEFDFSLLALAGGGGGAHQGMFGGFAIDSEHGGNGGTVNRTGTGDFGDGRVIPSLGGEGTDFAGGGGGQFVAGRGANCPLSSASGGGTIGSILGSAGGHANPCIGANSQDGGYGYGGGGAGRGSGGGGGGFIGGGAGGHTGAGGGGSGYIDLIQLRSYRYSPWGYGPEGQVQYIFLNNIPPVARCREATVRLADGSAVINWELIDNGSVDNDGYIASRVVFPASVTRVGIIEATLTITDENGASSECKSTIQVIDKINYSNLTQLFSSNTSLYINKKFYSDGDTIQANVVYCPMCPKFNDFVVFVSSTTGDAEGLRLKPYNATKSVTNGVLKVSDKGEVGQRDGILTVEPGETIIAYYYNYNLSEKNHSSGTQPDVITDFAFARSKESFEKSLMINKGYALSPNEDEDKSTTILEEGGGLPTEISSDIVIFYSKSDDDLKSFLSYSQGKVINMIPGANAKEGNAYSVQIPVKDENLNDLAQLRKFQGNELRFLSSNEEGMKLVQFCTIANLMGYKVSVNNKIQAFNDNSTISKSTTTASSFLTNPAGLNERIPGSFTQSFTDIRKVWNFMSIWDKDRTPVRVGIIDYGFHQNNDYRTNIDGVRFPLSECAVSFSSVDCGPSAAEGIPTVGAGLFGHRVWHGNGVEARAIGVLNNNFGTAGTGGQVGLPVIIKQNGADAYAFNMGGAVRAAVANGSQVINISGGYPCRALTSLGDLSYCDAGSRSDICAALFPIVSASSILACSVAAGFIPLPGVFEGCIAGTLTAYVGACTAQLAIGNTAEILSSAIQFAKSRGVAVVTSAGNFIRPENLPELLRPFVNLDENRMTVNDWQMIPASLPDVITVGAANPSAPFANNQVFGNRVDVWAPEDGLFVAPRDPLSPANAVTNPDQMNDRFNGTSAAAPFITGLIADALAINPTLNTPAGVERIRALLSSTAWQAADLPVDPTGRRRNLINPIAFLKSASLGTDIPTTVFNTLEYGDNWNIEDTENRDDNVAGRTIIPLDRSTGFEKSGSIIFIPGIGGASNIVDTDYYDIVIPETYSRFDGLQYVRISLRTPIGSRFGSLKINSGTSNFRLLRTEVISLTEEIKIYQSEFELVPNHHFLFSITGELPTEDNIYSLAISAVSCSPDYPYLRALYESTDGPNWTNTWDLNDCTCRGWYGVSLESDGRVRFLILTNNNLVGTVTGVGRLARLQWLNLSNNQLRGNIPSFAHHRRLLILDLCHNRFEGTIPSSLAEIPTLRTLRLDHNQLSGCFPASLNILCTRLTSYDFTFNPDLPGRGDFAAFCASGAGNCDCAMRAFYRDADRDGYGNPEIFIRACITAVPTGYISDNTDCNDANFAVHPGVADNTCNGIDDDCDGQIDEDVPLITYYRDVDGDSYGNTSIILNVRTCTPPAGYVTRGNDCNDNDLTINPGALDNTCNGLDENCDNKIDNGYISANCMTCLNGAIVNSMITYYQDLDGDGFGDPGVTKQACDPPTGFVANNTDCNDTKASINPGALDNTCNGIDDDCDSKIDEGYVAANCTTCADGKETTTLLTWYFDGDGDDYASAIKTACLTPGPGYTTTVLPIGDCNDADINIHPNALDNTCNGIDNDCDGKIDEDYVAANCTTCANGKETTTLLTWYYDGDGDGYASATKTTCLSPGPGYSTTLLPTGDCNDANATIHPKAADNTCNGIDENCNGLIDENAIGPLYFQDSDRDGYGDPLRQMNGSCTGGAPQGMVSNNTDCNDNNKNVYPGAADNTCNGIDENCNGLIDENAIGPLYFQDSDRDGYGDPLRQMNGSCTGGPPQGMVSNNADCNDNNKNVYPGAADNTCNGIDENCNGLIDENAIGPLYFQDADRDGYGDPLRQMNGSCTGGPPQGMVSNNTDCNDNNKNVYPGAADNTCNGIDENCNGAIDEGYVAGNCKTCINGTETTTPLITYYFDNDKDGYGNPSLNLTTCDAPPPGYTKTSGDCNDKDANIKPGATEICKNGIDENCDGKIDENCAPLGPDQNPDQLVLTKNFNVSPLKTSFKVASIELYPNPNAGDFIVTLHGIDITKATTLVIYSTIGSKVWEYKVLSADPIQVSLTQDHIPNGVYIMILKNADHIIEKKFIIQP